MKSVKKLFFYTIAYLFILGIASCKKDDTLRYNNVSIGNLVDGRFISDQGNAFNMVEMNTTVDLTKFRRGLMRCDVLKEVGNKEYDVRVNYMDSIFTKSPVLASIANTEEEKQVEDPIHIEQLWISGGYINLYIMFEIQINPSLKNSKHMINLVLDDSSQEAGKYTFTLRHNSFGETFAPQNTDAVNAEISTHTDKTPSWGFAGCYVSFPISELISEQTAELTLNWKSHIINGNAWRADIEDKSYKISYNKDEFEHAPLITKTKTTAQVE